MLVRLTLMQSVIDTVGGDTPVPGSVPGCKLAIMSLREVREGAYCEWASDLHSAFSELISESASSENIKQRAIQRWGSLDN